MTARLARRAITFAADLDTGLYRSGTNTVNVAAGGASVASFAAAVGITPTTTFTVSGGTTITLTPGEGGALTINPLGTGVTGGDINLISGAGSTTGGTVKLQAGAGGITSGNIDFWRNVTNSPALRVTDMGHLVGISGGSAEYAPTITSGGGTSPTIVGSDMAFKITLGATPGTTAIVVDFYQNYTAAPMVIAQYQSDHIALRAVATTSGITITPAAGMTQNHVIDVLVIGREDS
ncbi:MAG: hypothetical protein IPI51_07580 [Betaproteobacteria bacterium]|nr:hypothetical protein [Betaproteobacteria bacterium]